MEERNSNGLTVEERKKNALELAEDVLKDLKKKGMPEEEIEVFRGQYQILKDAKTHEDLDQLIDESKKDWAKYEKQKEKMDEIHKNFRPIKHYELGKTDWRLQTRDVTPEEMKTQEFKDLVQVLMVNVGLLQALGLAATQIGDERNVFVAFDGKFFRVFTNAKIIETKGEKYRFNEGCLTFFRAQANVSRYRSIKLSYLDLDGQQKEEWFGEELPELSEQELINLLDSSLKKEETETFWKVYFARVLQHEIEHNNNGSMIDHLGPVSKQMFLKKFQKRKNEEQKKK